MSNETILETERLLLQNRIAEAALIYGFNKLGFREIIALTDLENTVSQKFRKKSALQN